ncbi:MAG: class I SAM-dependent methyltransferase [Kiritimatiellia bacterium]
MIKYIKWQFREIARYIVVSILVPLFRPVVWYIVFHDLLRRPDHINYIRERLAFCDKYKDFFRGAVECKSRHEIYNRAVDEVLKSGHDGLWVEFGVWRGESINYIAKLAPHKTIYGLDSFEGLPVDWSQGQTKDAVISADYFKMYRLPRVRKNVRLIKGWFDKTLPVLMQDSRKHLSFIHIDSDVYKSAKTIFDIGGKHIAPGTVIVFDEYYNYPCWQEGEYKAFQEFVRKYDVKYDFIAFNSHGEQAALVIRSLNVDSTAAVS